MVTRLHVTLGQKVNVEKNTEFLQKLRSNVIKYPLYM